MFLFIFESIGTSELILIAAVALIIFGPRKLPQMAKTIGKTMSEFRNATNEFKTTWEKEIAFEEENVTNKGTGTENRIVQSNGNSDNPQTANQFSTPLIKELSTAEIAEKFEKNDDFQQTVRKEENINHNKSSEKRDWL